jgi:hypothetical protein
MEETKPKTTTKRKTLPAPPPGITLHQFYMAAVDVPENLSMTWGEMMVGPAPKDQAGNPVWSRELVLWWADVVAEFRRVYADAMVKAAGKR